MVLAPGQIATQPMVQCRLFPLRFIDMSWETSRCSAATQRPVRLQTTAYRAVDQCPPSKQPRGQRPASQAGGPRHLATNSILSAAASSHRNHPSIHPSTHPPIHPSTHPPVHPSTHPFKRVYPSPHGLSRDGDRIPTTFFLPSQSTHARNEPLAMAKPNPLVALVALVALVDAVLVTLKSLTTVRC